MSSTPVPPEIWRYILRLATNSPLNSPFSDTQLAVWTSWPWTRRDRPTLRVKLALTLVSRHFWQLGSEFLYEFLCLDSEESVQRLADVVGLHSSSNEAGTGLGKWTRVIRICPWYGEDVDVMAGNIIRILKNCRNLTGLSLRLTQHGHQLDGWPMHEPAIMQAIPHRICSFDWRPSTVTEWARIANSFHLLMVRTADSLHTLCLVRANLGSFAATLSLPHLWHLMIDEILPAADLGIICTWRLPALTSLKVKHLDNNDPTLEQLWRELRPNLRFVEIGNHAELSLSLARKILASSPSLHRLDYPYSPSCAEMWSTVRHPSLSYIVISLLYLNDIPISWPSYCEHISSLSRSAFPSLKTVIILNCATLRRGEVTESFERLKARLDDVTSSSRSDGIEFSYEP